MKWLENGVGVGEGTSPSCMHVRLRTLTCEDVAMVVCPKRSRARRAIKKLIAVGRDNQPVAREGFGSM